MDGKKSRARQLAKLVERPVKDFDPEADVPANEHDASSDAESIDQNAGTEHYAPIAKSKLRGIDPDSLGPKYHGVRVSRGALDQDEADASSDDYEDAQSHFDDPDTADLDIDQPDQEDAEIDSEDAFDESDQERFKGFVFGGSSQPSPKKSKHAPRHTAADFMGSDDDDDDGEDEDNLDEDEDEDDLDGDEDDESEAADFIDDEAEESENSELESLEDGEEDFHQDSDSGADDSEDNRARKKPRASKINGIAASIKEIVAGEGSLAKMMSQSMTSDIQKGKAVQRQRKGFDSLLNIRVRLQKSLVGINSFDYAVSAENQPGEPYEAAEKSALQLWQALDDFRTNIEKGKKRKRVDTADVSSKALWDRMQVHEQQQERRRNQVLEKWSRDAKKTSMMSNSGRRLTNNAEKSITTMLTAEMDAPERMIKRTRTPRSCAPYHAAEKVNEDEAIYDDADFYQLLLKELVDQRSDSSGLGLQAATVRYRAVKEAKAKRHVDTKASKGRKLRFTPLPKLQNFMAPEDRRTWEQSAIDRFFGTLFGQKLALHEETSDEMEDGVPVEAQGLRLF
ncbi:TRAUB-domain-containing protein [Xylariaceae sp. FL0255]|nr:TRAUB-domain-containing protein [Xylariaceae sp. FL0255]